MVNDPLNKSIIPIKIRAHKQNEYVSISDPIDVIIPADCSVNIRGKLFPDGSGIITEVEISQNDPIR